MDASLETTIVLVMMLHVSSASKNFKIVDGISEVGFSNVDANKLDEAAPICVCIQRPNPCEI